MASSSSTLARPLAGPTGFGRARGGRTGRPAPRPRARLDGLGAVRVALWCAVAALVLVPIAAILALAATGGGWSALGDPDVLGAARNSLVSAALSAVLAVVIGTALALLLERTDLPGRRALRMLALSPMLMPPFVGAIAWLSLLGPSSTVNTLWSQRFGAPLWNLYGGDGVVFLLTLHSYPIAMMIVTAALRRVPADLEQAARIAGSSAPRALWEVTTPLLRPAMLSSLTLIAVSNLADFGIPSIIGLPERYVTLSTLVYRYLQSGTVDDPLAVVSAIGFVLLVIALLGVVVDLMRARTRVELDAQAGSPALLPLGRARAAVGALTATVVLAATVLPLITLAIQSLLPAPGVPLSPETVTLASFGRALGASGTLTGIGNSLMLATLAGLICGVLGLGIGTFVTRTRARSNPALLGLSLLPQAIPGLVIAVAWLVIAPRIGLYNTPWLILCAYLTSFLALVVQSVHAPLSATPTTAEEAARVSGATRLRALWDISCRMAVPAAISGAVLVALTAVRELTLSVLLLSPGSQTLGVVIFNLQQAGAYNASSALSLIVAVVGLAGLGLTARTPR
ncbi:ABC transporter permease [Leucobacter chromiiresistens]|uniref:Iron(III) transport system permease protein n=1 Tax=Leucobacter chromiiresistens TaxID=1079994 RepID=A0A1H0Z842_9MICO|nr:iron ABC transporter permease [Leucobacter chromiiresistens]SDQ23615.1 iron(III) transport system permease protein [Leucobacter chromiiresistens]